MDARGRSPMRNDSLWLGHLARALTCKRWGETPKPRLSQMLLQKRERFLPPLLGRLLVGAFLAGLLTKESVAGVVVGVSIVRLAEFLHRGGGGLDGGCDARIVP